MGEVVPFPKPNNDYVYGALTPEQAASIMANMVTIDLPGALADYGLAIDENGVITKDDR